MTILRAAYLALVCVILAAPQALPAQQDAGLPALDGPGLTQKALAEGSTIIVVWASWSPRGRDLGERVAEIADRWSGRARVITVNFQEEPERARAFAQAQKLRVPVYLDRDAVFAKRHAVTSLPFLLVLKAGETGFAGKLPPNANQVIAGVLE